MCQKKIKVGNVGMNYADSSGALMRELLARTWQVMAGHGWPWPAMAGLGRPWPALLGRPWPALRKGTQGLRNPPL